MKIPDYITIHGAREGNLKNISLSIPRNRLVALTGLSGSGKSTLALDLLYQECQRQYLEAMAFQGIQKPAVDWVRGLSPAIQVTQGAAARSPRSTLGTLTDIYTDLRMLYEKLSLRPCPACGQTICAADCREETEKSGADFKVFQFCPHCGYRMEKLTRTWFSYNTREGACPACQGLGQVPAIQDDLVLHPEKALEDGGVDFWEHRYGAYQTDLFHKALAWYRLPLPEAHTPIKAFSKIQKTLLLYGSNSQELLDLLPPDSPAPPKTTAQGWFEGVYPVLWRRLSQQQQAEAQAQPAEALPKEGAGQRTRSYFTHSLCPDCQGERLNPLSRSVTVAGIRLPQLSALSLEELLHWVQTLAPTPDTAAYLEDLETKLSRAIRVGLGYLTLDRQTGTLSGGELQRLRLAAALDTSMTGLIYILDEPTAGLHPRDTLKLVSMLKELRDMGNTVLVIEHDLDFIREADYVIDLGPGSGRQGGQVIGTGTPRQLMRQPVSITGRWLKRLEEQKAWGGKTVPDSLAPFQPEARESAPGSPVLIRHARMHNLKDISVQIPTGCLTAVIGASGSGKSTLVFDVLADTSIHGRNGQNQIEGLEQFQQIVTARQAPPVRMRRSNVATYTELYNEIRRLFSRQPAARAQGLTPRHFSFNTPGGRCETCQGLGTVTSNLLFFKDVDVTCPDCHGARFLPEVLAVAVEGRTIGDVLDMTVEEAAVFFGSSPALSSALSLLQEVGLGYLTLGQSLTTLSGGEAQRLKLARELLSQKPGSKTLFLLDEPTTGLHPEDVEQFLRLLARLTGAGHTVVVVEHSPQLICRARWIVELGPQGGTHGGQVLYQGPARSLPVRPAGMNF